MRTSLKGALNRPKDRNRFAMCGTAAPDARAFERVPCSARHTWRAIDVVTFPEGKYPGLKKVREAGRRALIESGARKEVLMMVPVVFLVLPVTVLFAFWPGFIGLTLTY